MAEMRAFEPADLPAVTELLEANLPPWTTAEEGISGNLADTYLGNPWSDPELPSLVAVDENGKAIGFIGAQVKRVRLDDRTLRGVCISHLTVHPEARGGATGALLLRRLLTQGQDFTYSDTANDEVVRMWHAFGGHLDHARAFDWMVVLKPVSWLSTLGTDTVMRRDVGRGQIPVGALPFQAARPRSGRWTFPEPDPDVTGAPVDTAEIIEHLPEMAREFRLWVDYDEGFLDHVFDRMDSHFGGLVRRMVRRGDRPVGWYAYVPKRRGVSRLLHLMSADADADAVLGDLVEHARGEKTAVLTGRHEPHLTLPLQRRLPVLGFARRPVVHSHDPEIYSALASRSSILTQLDGEWFIT